MIIWNTGTRTTKPCKAHTHTLPRPHFYIYIFAFVTFALWLCDRHLASRSDFVSVLLPVFVFLFHILDQRQVLNICYVCSKCVWDEKESEREEDARFTHFIANRKRLFSPLKKWYVQQHHKPILNERAVNWQSINATSYSFVSFEMQFFHVKKFNPYYWFSAHLAQRRKKHFVFRLNFSLAPKKCEEQKLKINGAKQPKLKRLLANCWPGNKISHPLKHLFSSSFFFTGAAATTFGSNCVTKIHRNFFNSAKSMQFEFLNQSIAISPANTCRSPSYPHVALARRCISNFGWITTTNVAFYQTTSKWKKKRRKTISQIEIDTIWKRVPEWRRKGNEERRREKYANKQSTTHI